MEKRSSQLEHGQPMEQTRGLFARVTRVRLAVNHNSSITYGLGCNFVSTTKARQVALLKS